MSMSGGALWGIFLQTYKVTIRSKWLIIFAVVFFLFSFNLPFLSTSLLAPISSAAASNFVQVVISTSFALMPLLALPVAAVSIVEERESGSLSYILSTPTSRGKFIVARAAGLYAATTTIIVLGFTLAALLAFRLSSGSLQMWYVTEAACLLNAAMIGIAMVISTVSKKRLTAYGLAIFVWFLLTYAGDTSISGPVLASAGRYWILIPTIFMNPVEVSRLIAIYSLNVTSGSPLALASTDLGATGEALIYVFGLHGAYEVLIVTMAMWTTITLMVTFLIMTFQDIK